MLLARPYSRDPQLSKRRGLSEAEIPLREPLLEEQERLVVRHRQRRTENRGQTLAPSSCSYGVTYAN
jgi:hypothetical protein